MMRRLLLGALLSAVGGCAGAGPEPTTPMPVLTDVSQISAGPGTNHFKLTLFGGRSLDALVGDRSITALDVSLTRYTDASDHAIRGEAFKRVVNIDITPTGAKGLYGGGPMNIEVKLVPPEFHVTGTVAGKITDFKMGPSGISGSVGQCMFQMSRKGAVYAGSRGCRTGSEPSEVTFPAAFEKWSLPEMGAALVILLSTGA